jgi:hypothetical protein
MWLCSTVFSDSMWEPPHDDVYLLGLRWLLGCCMVVTLHALHCGTSAPTFFMIIIIIIKLPN